MITVIPPEKGKHPLLAQRFGELPFPAYIELDLEGRAVSFTYSEWNSEPTHVSLGHARRWLIDAKTSRRAAIKLAKELEPLFERVCDGYDSDWDGRNHVGILDDDARAAAKEVSSRLEAMREAA
jgi:hypothetical protein